MTRMLALRGFAGESEPRLVETERPEVGPDDVLVRIKSAGLSLGTFSLFRAGFMSRLPMTFGHEGAGVVEAVGRNVTRVQVGNRVRVEPNLSCGSCRHCTSGLDQMCARLGTMGFTAFGSPIESWSRYHNGVIAEYVLAPMTHVDTLPDHVSFDVGAKLHYLANARYNLRLAALSPGSTLGILGASGAMGVATLKLLPSFGVQKVVLIGRSSKRLTEAAAISPVPTQILATDQLAKNWVETGELAGRVQEMLPEGADAMIDYLPDGGDHWQAINGIMTGGTLVNMGGGPSAFRMPMRVMVAKCLRIVGARNHPRLDSIEVLRMLRDSRFSADDLITHRAPLAHAAEAVTLLQSRSEGTWMSVVQP